MNNTSYTNFLEELRQKTDIVSVISRYITLNRKGKTYWGLCPFHNEKTPSFAVNEDEQFYHCFGCKASGDAFSFVMNMENCGFSDAVKILADWANLKVPDFESSENAEEVQKKKDCLAALRDAAMYYHDSLNSPIGKEAREYLERRGVSDSLARVFGLGYCPDFKLTEKVLLEKGHKKDTLLAAGILKPGEYGLYDPMAQRVVFPILNVYGEVVAFSGRTMKKQVDHAKYLNTSETLVYSKRKNLYAINLIKKYKKKGEKFEYFVIVEGNMDVVSLHKAGFHSAVAGMGTALTSEQAKLIKRFVDKVYICYDGDTAGQKATMLGLSILKKEGLDVFVMSLPKGKDPDDVVKEGGRQAFLELMDQALPVVEYKLKKLSEQFDLSSYDGKSKFANEALVVLKEFCNEVEAETYLPLIQKLSGTNRDFLRRQMLEGTAKVMSEQKKSAEEKKEGAEQKTFSKAEKFVLSALYHKLATKEFEDAKNNISYFDELLSQDAKLLINAMNNIGTPTGLCEKFPELSSVIGEIVVLDISSNKDVGKEFEDCIRLLQKQYLSKRQEELAKQIDSEPEREKRQKLLEELTKITKERNLYRL